MQKLALCLTITAFLSLSACGGGSSSNPSTSDPQSPVSIIIDEDATVAQKLAAFDQQRQTWRDIDANIIGEAPVFTTTGFTNYMYSALTKTSENKLLFEIVVKKDNEDNGIKFDKTYTVTQVSQENLITSFAFYNADGGTESLQGWQMLFQHGSIISLDGYTSKVQDLTYFLPRLLFYQGQSLTLGEETQFSRDEIKFGGEKTRTAQKTVFGTDKSIIVSDIFQLTLGLQYLGYDQTDKMHQVSIKLLQYQLNRDREAKLFISDYAFTDVELDRFKLYSLNDNYKFELSYSVANTDAANNGVIRFGPDAPISFNLRSYPESAVFQSSDIWANSSFSASVFGLEDDIDQLYIAGTYLIRLNENNDKYKNSVNEDYWSLPSESKVFFGAFVLPKL